MHKIILSFLIFFSTSAYSDDESGTSSKEIDVNKEICYQVYDPYESFNRATFTFNDTLDQTILKPAATLYNKAVPSWGRDRVRSFFVNLASPLTFLNNLLQGDPDAAAKTFFRFMINSTFGILGTIDYAKDFGLYQNPQKFGDTFARYGANYGAYLVLPFIGSTDVRSAVGIPFDIALNPSRVVLNNKEMLAAYLGARFTGRAEILDYTSSLQASSLDYYAQIRSMYTQYAAKRNPRCAKSTQIDYTLYNDDSEE
ncbi:MAG: VacJ family lipoprotein [Rickettsiales bacterium]